jgi:hypothetical protein
MSERTKHGLDDNVKYNVVDIEVKPGQNIIAPPVKEWAPSAAKHGEGKQDALQKATFTEGKLGNFEPKEPPARNAPGKPFWHVSFASLHSNDSLQLLDGDYFSVHY